MSHDALSTTQQHKTRGDVGRKQGLILVGRCHRSLRDNASSQLRNGCTYELESLIGRKLCKCYPTGPFDFDKNGTADSIPDLFFFKKINFKVYSVSHDDDSSVP